MHDPTASDPPGEVFRLFFETAPGAFLVLAPDRPRFTILAASDAYLDATRTTREIVGRGIFEVFPDDPDDPESTGSPARASFERVLATGRPDTMAVQKHSLRRPEAEGAGFEERYWSPLNTPVLGARGEVLYIHHRVEDVTEFVRQRQRGAEQQADADLLRSRADAMEADVLRRARELQEVNRQLRVANERLAGLDRERERLAAEALRESEERYRTLFANMTEGFALGEAICDDAGVPRDFRLLEMNEAFEAQSGLERERARGRPMRQVLPGLERSWVDAYCAVALGAPARRFEMRNDDLGRDFEVYCFSPSPGRFAILFTDVTERKRAADEVRHAAELLDLGDAMVEVDRDWRVVRVNAAQERISHLPRARSLGRSFWEVWPESARPDSKYWQEYRRCMAERVPVQFEEYYGPLDLWTDITAYPTRRGGIVIFFRDVGPRKRAEEALREANERLREADRRKDEFLGMLSHELRNPLAAIGNSTFILRQAAPGSEPAGRAQAVIERQAGHLARLVDDLLDVTRIARGKVELRRRRVDLREVVRRAAEDFRLPMDERGVSFRSALPEAEAWAEVDPTRVTQIVGNLLHNAAKFTRRGEEVSCTLAVRGGEAVLEVRDSGAGIDAALLPRLFEPFVQGERSLARTDGGLGLGLALVKGIAELHGGAASAESAGPGQGARFEVRLPLAAGPPREEPAGRADRRR